MDVLTRTRELPCIACNKPPPSDPAHVLSRGAGGNDSELNIMPLCRFHHRLQHDRGWSRFTNEQPRVDTWLKERGWEWNQYGKLFHPNARR